MLKTKNIPGKIATRLMTAAVVFLAIALISGCREQGPVALVGGGPGGPIEVVAHPPQPMPGLELGGADSAGIMPLPPQKVAGHIIIAGARYDGPLETVEATLGRAILFDLGSPIQLGGDRMTFKTIDMGSVDLDGIPLFKIAKRVRLMMGGDTLIGVQYVRYNRWDGGFRYAGGVHYTWTATGGGSLPPFTTGITAPTKLLVQTPTPGTPVSAAEDLRVRWTGGGAAVHLVISNAGDARIDSRPILHIRLGKNDGGAVVPARILKLLPSTRDRFVFTFFSEASRIESLDGFPDDVLVQALTSHSIMIRMTR